MRITIISLIYIFLAACSTTTGEKNLMDVIIKNDGGLLRGINLGINPDEVKSIESIGLTEETPDYLFYEFIIDTSNSYTVSYTFENNALTEIRADIYVSTDSTAKNLTDSFIEYFSGKYKEPEAGGANLWAWPTLYNDTSIRIELSDESIDYNHVGKLSLVIYQEPEMAM